MCALVYGLVAAPCAWFSAQLVSAGVAQQACFPQYAPLAAPAFPGSHLMAGLALTAALAVCASGAWTAFVAGRRTHGEHAGHREALLDIGEGRSRFMALAGLLTSIGFLIGVLFSLPAVVLIPAC